MELLLLVASLTAALMQTHNWEKRMMSLLLLSAIINQKSTEEEKSHLFRTSENWTKRCPNHKPQK